MVLVCVKLSTPEDSRAGPCCGCGYLRLTDLKIRDAPKLVIAKVVLVTYMSCVSATQHAIKVAGGFTRKRPGRLHEVTSDGPKPSRSTVHLILPAQIKISIFGRHVAYVGLEDPARMGTVRSWSQVPNRDPSSPSPLRRPPRNTLFRSRKGSLTEHLVLSPPVTVGWLLLRGACAQERFIRKQRYNGIQN